VAAGPDGLDIVTYRAKRRSVLWLATAGVTASLVYCGSALSAPAQIEAKQAEAEQVLAQIQQIDSDLSRAVDAYNAATEKLARLEEEIQATKHRLGIARRANVEAQQRLGDRVVALYESGGEDTLLEVILGSSSLDEILDRVDAADRISTEDRRILDDVRTARTEYRAQVRQLGEARREQKQVVADRAARRLDIEQRLVERQQLYNSIRDEIERLEAEERERQERLQAEAERRLSETPVVSSSSFSSAGGPTTTAVPGSRFGGVVGIAMQFLGIPYQWGGSSPSTGFDCSGFVMYVYAQVGVSLPHNAAAQYGYGVAVSRDQLQPGDLVFFDGLGHDGIYIGGGQFIHSPHTGDVVKISSLYDSWYSATYVGARRIL
jgi:cell wall-associated NlpC family hydrolase